MYKFLISRRYTGMDQSHDSIVSMGEFRPMVVSPGMSPQLNETICGCRCGCGCGCAGDGDINESERLSDSETAINSSESEDSESPVPTQCTAGDGANGEDSGHPNAGVFAPRAMSRQFIVWLRETTENLRLSNILLGQEHVSARSVLYNINEGATESPLNEARGAETLSSTVSGERTVQMMSPGPGIGGWVPVGPEVTFVEHVQGSYILTPLRLSAE